MIMAGYEFKGKRPFKDVYFTGMVRDKKRRKMSKSLGNSPDPLDLIDKYGADGVRVGMLMTAPAGNDLLLMRIYVLKVPSLQIRFGMPSVWWECGNPVIVK